VTVNPYNKAVEGARGPIPGLEAADRLAASLAAAELLSPLEAGADEDA
jgi:hypothetical protein